MGAGGGGGGWGVSVRFNPLGTGFIFLVCF